MIYKEQIKDHFLNGHKIYLPHISVDCVIFGFHENELKVLLLKANYAGKWALPGGFVLKEEHLDDSAKRILKERTGLDKIYLQQFHVFSAPERSTKKINRQFLANTGVAMDESWMFERFISVGYSALVDFTKVQPVADIFSDACKWFSINEIPSMILDHRHIFETALENLRKQLSFSPVGYNLLGKKFTMPELHSLYETILDTKLDRRNFQRKIIASRILTRLEETKKGVAHKAPFYYKFNVVEYTKALKSGINFQI